MSISMLLVDTYLVRDDEDIVGPGYIRVSNGVISHVGVGEPPEDAQIAELVLGGPGRLLYPGFAALVYPETYIIRDYIGDSEGLPSRDVEKCIREMSEEEAFYTILMALYEMSLAGYTRIVLVTPHAEVAVKAIQEAGIDGAILLPVGSPSEVENALDLIRKIDSRGIAAGLLESTDTKSLVYTNKDIKIKCIVKNKCSIICQDKTIIPYGCQGDGIVAPLYPFITPAQILWRYRRQGFISLVQEAHRLIDNKYVALRENSRAYIAVYNLSEPPSWIGQLEQATPYVLTPLSRVETLVSNGRLIIDGGEHLFLGPSVSEEASKTLLNVRKRCRRLLA